MCASTYWLAVLKDSRLVEWLGIRLLETLISEVTHMLTYKLQHYVEP